MMARLVNFQFGFEGNLLSKLYCPTHLPQIAKANNLFLNFQLVETKLFLELSE